MPDSRRFNGEVQEILLGKRTEQNCMIKEKGGGRSKPKHNLRINGNKVGISRET